MKRNRQDHLTEEAMDDVHMGCGSTDALAHLDGCEVCRHRMEGFSADIKMLDQASLAWNEARSNSMPVVTASQKRTGLRPFWMAVSTAMSIAIILGGILVSKYGPITHQRRTAAVHVSKNKDGPIMPKSALAENNILLLAIDREIAPIPSPLDAYRETRPLTIVVGRGARAAQP